MAKKASKPKKASGSRSAKKAPKGKKPMPRKGRRIGGGVVDPKPGDPFEPPKED
jgi:hypothetical protein